MFKPGERVVVHRQDSCFKGCRGEIVRVGYRCVVTGIQSYWVNLVDTNFQEMLFMEYELLKED